MHGNETMKKGKPIASWDLGICVCAIHKKEKHACPQLFTEYCHTALCMEWETGSISGTSYVVWAYTYTQAYLNGGGSEKTPGKEL